MVTFTFTCGNETFQTEARTPGAAMEAANRQFLDKLPESPYPGAWDNAGITEVEFVWRSGNFFD